jgi:hypothetical protein
MRAYLARLGDLQSEILLGLVYLVVVLPVWLATRATGSPLLDVRPRWHRGRPASGSSMRDPF